MNKKRAFTLIELLVALSIVAIMIAIVMGGVGKLVVGGGTEYFTERTAIIEPIRLYIVPSKGTESTSYRCYAKVLRGDPTDENLSAETTFEITDSILKGQYRSADLYGKLREGEAFKIAYYGIRNGFLDEFPKIIGVRSAEAEDDLYD